MVGRLSPETHDYCSRIAGGECILPDACRGVGLDNTVVVIDEAGMVANPELVEILSTVKAAGVLTVLVGDPSSTAVSPLGSLATLAEELRCR